MKCLQSTLCSPHPPVENYPLTRWYKPHLLRQPRMMTRIDLITHPFSCLLYIYLLAPIIICTPTLRGLHDVRASTLLVLYQVLYKYRTRNLNFITTSHTLHIARWESTIPFLCNLPQPLLLRMSLSLRMPCTPQEKTPVVRRLIEVSNENNWVTFFL